LQFLDDNGDPLNGGFLYTYTAGTNTPKATYTTADGDIENTNPVVLDSAGRASVWINGSYKFVVKDSLLNTIRTVDNITSFTTTENDADPFFQSFSGTGAQTAFTLSESLGTDEKTIMVFVDAGGGKGFDIYAPTAYTLNGTALTFSVAPASGTNNIYVLAPSLLLGAAAASAAAADASATTASNAADVALAVSRGYVYEFSTNTAATDPTAGILKFNNVTISSATALYISETTDEAFSIDADLTTWDDSTSTIKGRIRLVKQSDTTKWALFNVLSTSDASGWKTFTVAYVDGNGSFNNTDALTISFVPKGDKGDTGPNGPGTGDMLAATYDAANIAEQLVGLTASQSLSNKTYVEINGFHSIEFTKNGTYIVYLSAQVAETLTALVGITSGGGISFDVSLRINGVQTASITGANDSQDTTTTFSDDTVAVGQKLDIVITNFTGSGTGNVYIHTEQDVV
jgi:hypothetical protein